MRMVAFRSGASGGEVLVNPALVKHVVQDADGKACHLYFADSDKPMTVKGKLVDVGNELNAAMKD